MIAGNITHTSVTAVVATHVWHTTSVSALRLRRSFSGSVAVGASLSSALRGSHRQVSSTKGPFNDNDVEGPDGKSEAVGGGEKTVHSSASTAAAGETTRRGLGGWKRFISESQANPFDLPSPTSLSSSLSPTEAIASSVDRKIHDDEARREATSARLMGMFAESAKHSQWMQEQRQKSRESSEYKEEAAPARRVRSAHHTVESSRMEYAFDEDKEGDIRSGTTDETAATALVATTGTEVLEQELLDDDFLYYPPLKAKDGVGSAEAMSTTPREEPERYVPGQQVIPPGLTRYRVDVQYQGSDFDGWYKSVQRKKHPKHAAPAGSTATAAAAEYGAGSHHFARVVTEEALAVALDVASVSIVAAAIPETGVSVRRLTCHVDVPSEVELQPRTILQRATLWLHQRRQPLAILSCHPCRNQDFHARHSGVRRVYCYRILNRIAPPLFDAGLQWHVDRYLDVSRMQRMARLMEGTHDYGFFTDPKMANALRRAAASTGSGRGGPVVSSAYSAEHEPLTSHGLAPGEVPAAPKVTVQRGLSGLERAAALPTFNEYGQRVTTYQAKPHEYHRAKTNLPTVRTVDKIEVVRQEDEVLLWFVGQSFLRQQIRNMVSVLKASGHGLWDDQEIHHAFQSGFEVSRKRFQRERLPPAPVHGLTLWDVEYRAQHRSDFVPYVDAGPYEPVDISLHQ